MTTFWILTSSLLLGDLVSATSLRVNGGDDGRISDFPYFGYIASGNSPYDEKPVMSALLCGSVLINDRHILTHASCVNNYTKSGKKLFVQFGVQHWCPPRETAKEFNFYSWLETKKASIQSGHWNDGIAIVPLTKAITSITPSFAPVYEEPFIEATFQLPGYGRTSTVHSHHSCIPMVLDVVPVPKPNCSHHSSGVLCFRKNSEVCGGVMDGDQGGPIIELIEDRVYLRGIAWKQSETSCGGQVLAWNVGPLVPWIRDKAKIFK